MTIERPMFPPRQAEDDSLYFPTDVQPEQIFVAIGQLRKDARDEVDRLIRFLDKTDDYVRRELEDSADDNPQEEAGEEPSLGFLDHMTKPGANPGRAIRRS
jgi:hypothetical protein